MCLERSSGFFVAMRCEVVENHCGSWRDLRDQHLLHVGRKAGPSMAPLITQGAIKASTVNPAIRVWFPQLPKGASIVRRSPRGAQPRSRVRFGFTAVSSIKITRSGILTMAGKRCVNQSLRRCFTLAWRRSVATSDFFVREPEAL